MKYITAILGGIPAFAAATVLVTVIPPFNIGGSYQVDWLLDRKMELELLLVKQNENGWAPVKTLFEGVEGTPCNGSYIWHVDESYPTGTGYGLWISGMNLPKDNTGYADLTDWFEIMPKA